jgi:hypothetical protein
MVAALLQQSYLPHWDAVGLQRVMDFSHELAERHGSWELSFSKSPDVVDFLMEKTGACSPGQTIF